MRYIEFSERQTLEFNNSYQLYLAWQDAQKRADQYMGSMHWKNVNGTEYLYRIIQGKAKSLGSRNLESEARYSAFQKGKAESKDRLKSINAALDEKAALNRAVGLNRVPLIVARIARELDKRELLGNNVIIAGTNAIYAYEALAGITVRPQLMATADADFLWDNRKKVNLAMKNEVGGFLDILKQVDNSFVRSKQLFRAINKDGFMADLIVPEPKNPMTKTIEQMGNEFDLKATGIGSLRWLVNSPMVEATAIDSRGYPFPIFAPDPRCFAIHKLWLSEQLNRRADKAGRDREQAITIAQLVIDRLPQFKFELDQLKMFPREVADKGIEKISRFTDK